MPPYQWLTWLMVFSALLLVVVLLLVIDRFTRRARHAALDAHYGAFRRRERPFRTAGFAAESAFLLLGQVGRLDYERQPQGA